MSAVVEKANEAGEADDLGSQSSSIAHPPPRLDEPAGQSTTSSRLHPFEFHFGTISISRCRLCRRVLVVLVRVSMETPLPAGWGGSSSLSPFVGEDEAGHIVEHSAEGGHGSGPGSRADARPSSPLDRHARTATRSLKELRKVGSVIGGGVNACSLDSLTRRASQQLAGAP